LRDAPHRASPPSLPAAKIVPAQPMPGYEYGP
jgi:hypothetical protein